MIAKNTKKRPANSTCKTQLRKTELSDLADQANEYHAKYRAALGNALEYALEAGKALTKAKRKVGHGGWQAWVKQYFHASIETAQVYMRVTHGYKEFLKQHAEKLAEDAEEGLPVNASNVKPPKLSIAKVLAMLKGKYEPSPPHTFPADTQYMMTQEFAATAREWHKTEYERITKGWPDELLIFLYHIDRCLGIVSTNDFFAMIRADAELFSKPWLYSFLKEEAEIYGAKESCQVSKLAQTCLRQIEDTVEPAALANRPTPIPAKLMKWLRKTADDAT